MRTLVRPKCECLQCEYMSFVYNSAQRTHSCLECDVKVPTKYLDAALSAFSLKRSDPLLLSVFNKVDCMACLSPGGIFFKSDFEDIYSCYLCKCEVPIVKIIDAKVIALRTILMETSYCKVFKDGY